MFKVLQQLLSNDGKPFTLLEEALAINELKNYGWQPEEIKASYGKSITHITNCILLAEGTSKNLQAKIIDGTISATQVISMLKAKKTSDEILETVKEVVKRKQENKENAEGQQGADEFTEAKNKAKARVTAKDAADPDEKSIKVKKLSELYLELKDNEDVNLQKLSALESLTKFFRGEITLSELHVQFNS